MEVEKIIEANIIRAKGEANTEYYDHSSVIIQEPYTGEVLAMASKKLVNGEMVDNVTSILTVAYYTRFGCQGSIYFSGV